MRLFRSIALTSVLLVSSCTDQDFNASDLDPYSVLPGKWGWQDSDDCAVSPEVFRINSHSEEFFSAHAPIKEDGTREPRREVKYQVLERLPYGLRMGLENEQRLDSAGKPVVWDLVLVDQNTVCWHRTDWRSGGCTKRILRCKI